MSDTNQITFESVGLKGYVNNVPQTEEEWNLSAGPNGYTMRDAALDQIKFHGFLGDFRQDLMDIVIKQFGVEPLKKDHPDKKDDKGNPVQVVAEKPAAYLERVAGLNGKSTSQLFQGLADDWSAKAQFPDWLKVRPRGEGGPSVGKRDLAAATEILGNADRLARTRKAMSDHGIIVPDSPTPEQYAQCIRELRQRLEAAALA